MICGIKKRRDEWMDEEMNGRNKKKLADECRDSRVDDEQKKEEEREEEREKGTESAVSYYRG